MYWKYAFKNEEVLVLAELYEFKNGPFNMAHMVWVIQGVLVFWKFLQTNSLLVKSSFFCFILFENQKEKRLFQAKKIAF